MTSEPPLRRFYVSSLGEYGLQYLDGTENTSGSVNINEFAAEIGKSSDALTDQDWKRKWDSLLYGLVTDRIQVTVMRCWEHVQPLQDGTFRFYAGVTYLDESRNQVVEPYLTMSIEYAHDDADTPFWDKLTALARQNGAKVDDMWTHEDDGINTRQVSVDWPVFGKSFGAVARLQTNWMTASRELEADIVGVI